MQAECFELTGGDHLAPVEAGDARRRWRAGDGAFWIDLKECSATELAAMLDELGVGTLVKRRMLRVGNGTGIIALRDVTFAEWSVFADESLGRRAHVAVLCLKNLLITVQSEPIESPAETLQSQDLSELGVLTTASVLCSILLWQGATSARAARALRERLLEVDQRLDEDPDSVDTPDLTELKADLLRAEAIAEEQDEAFALLSESQTDALDFSALRAPMGLLTSTASATRRLNDRLEGRFMNLWHRVSEGKQDALNRRLGFLTVISTIFLPLTLLAGIWGMNFHVMPELDTPYGYPIALGLMLVVASGVAWFLHKRGWFR